MAFAVKTDAISNWIFVTGMIRSGTTFLGKILSYPLSVDYIHEPFHGGYTLPERLALLPRYVRPGDKGQAVQAYGAQVKKLFSYDIGMRTSRYDGDPWQRKLLKAIVGSRGPFYLRLAKSNPFHTAAVIKDPIARLVAEFLYNEFNVTPVILVRHPVSLAASLRRLDWYPEVHEFRVQPQLIEDYLEDERETLHRMWPNRLLEAMGAWRLTYKVLLQQAEAHADWQVVTHEDLSQQPVSVAARLYEALELPWSDRVAAKVRSWTDGTNPAKARPGRVQDFNRDSARIFEMRRDSVPVELRREIFDVVEDVALQLYSRESFAID